MGFEKKKYIYDSYLSEYTADVLSCKNTDNGYELILDSTIFYPDMVGGQPRDFGTINGIEVKNVIERDDEVIHILDKPLQGNVKLQIDMGRRIDIMQQHTGQHILSCSFAILFNAKTIGFHLSGEYTTIDLDVSNFSEEMIIEVEQFANKIIYDNLVIETEILSRKDALKENLRKLIVDDEIIRLVKIGNKDNVACCGTHLNRTGEVGIVKIIKFEKYKTGTRVEFLCGKRALNDYITKDLCISKLAYEFSCHSTKIEENIFKLKKDNLEKTKKLNSLQTLLNEYKAKEYINNAVLINNIKYIYIKDNDCDVKQLRNIVSLITVNNDYICCILAKNETSLNLIISKSKNISYNLKSLFKECADKAGIKGGGNDFMIQGSGNDISKINEIDAIMNKVMHI